MHIALVTHKVSPCDGQGRVNYEVAMAALSRGHQLTLLASEIAPALRENPSVTWVPIDVRRWPTALLREQVFAWKSARWVRMHRSELDLVVANGAITWAPSDVNAVHFVHREWRKHMSFEDASLLTWGYQALYTVLNSLWEQWALARTQSVVAVSELVRSHLVAGGLQAPCRVIPNGVDTTEFSPGEVDRTRLGLPSDVPLALFVGDLQTTRKNLDTVLHALKGVPSLHLAVVGNTEHSPYPSLARDLAVSDRVHFLGFRRDVPHLMRAATFCVCPSRYEPFSLVVLEALASGLPVVTARSVGAASLVASDCGFVLDDPEDTEGLIRVFQYLLDHPDERRQMGQAGRAVAERNTFHAMGHAYVDLFEEYRSRTASGTPESPHPLAAERVGDEPPHGVRSSTTRTKKPQADG